MRNVPLLTKQPRLWTHFLAHTRNGGEWGSVAREAWSGHAGAHTPLNGMRADTHIEKIRQGKMWPSQGTVHVSPTVRSGKARTGKQEDNLGSCEIGSSSFAFMPSQGGTARQTAPRQRYEEGAPQRIGSGKGHRRTLPSRGLCYCPCPPLRHLRWHLPCARLQARVHLYEKHRHEVRVVMR